MSGPKSKQSKRLCVFLFYWIRNSFSGHWCLYLILCRWFVWTVPGSSPGARPLPGICTHSAQIAGSAERSDGARSVLVFFTVNIWRFTEQEKSLIDRYLSFPVAAQVWRGGMMSPRRLSAESWVTFRPSALTLNFTRRHPNSTKTYNL